jgi:hypothetical protein
MSSAAPLLGSRAADDGHQERRRCSSWLGRVVDTEEAWAQLRFSGPMILMNIFYYGIPLVSVMFSGHLGDVQLAGATLGNSWVTVTGYAFVVSPHTQCIHPKLASTSIHHLLPSASCFSPQSAMCVPDRPERRPGDAVRAGLRRRAVPPAGPVPAVVAHHGGGGGGARLRAVGVHGAGAAAPAAGAPGVPRCGRVRPRPDPRALRLRLPAVLAPVPADAVRRPAARRLLRRLVRAPRRAGVPARGRARPRHRRRVRRRLRHLLGRLHHAACLRAAVRGRQRDVEGLLRRGVPIRAAHREARRAVSRHGLVN